MPPLRWDNNAMTAAEEPISHDGFEISVDEAAYLVEYLDLIGLLPEVLAVYNPMTSAELVDGWKAHQHQRLTERGILTSTGALEDGVVVEAKASLSGRFWLDARTGWTRRLEVWGPITLEGSGMRGGTAFTLRGEGGYRAVTTVDPG